MLILKQMLENLHFQRLLVLDLLGGQEVSTVIQLVVLQPVLAQGSVEEMEEVEGLDLQVLPVIVELQEEIGDLQAGLEVNSLQVEIVNPSIPMETLDFKEFFLLDLQIWISHLHLSLSMKMLMNLKKILEETQKMVTMAVLEIQGASAMEVEMEKVMEMDLEKVE